MKKMTQVARMQCYMRATMYEVLELTGMSEQLYCQYKFSYGMAYLEAYMSLTHGVKMEDWYPPRDRDVTQISLTAEYWGWWKLHWYHRDQEFANNRRVLELPDAAARHGIWLVMHHPYDLARGDNPEGMAMETSFSRDLVPKMR